MGTREQVGDETRLGRAKLKAGRREEKNWGGSLEFCFVEWADRDSHAGG